MSMVSTFVESKEGHWYKNPVIRGDGWFICYDDDEPIEIVVMKEKNLRIGEILEDLAKQGWELKMMGRYTKNASRLFENDRFHSAVSCFLKQVTLGPSDKLLEGNERCVQKPRGDGVYYSNTPNGNGGFE